MAYKTLSVDSKMVEIINALKTIGGYKSTQEVLDHGLSCLMLGINGPKVGDKLLVKTEDGKELILPKEIPEAIDQLNHKLHAKFGGVMPKDHHCEHC